MFSTQPLRPFTFTIRQRILCVQLIFSVLLFTSTTTAQSASFHEKIRFETGSGDSLFNVLISCRPPDISSLRLPPTRTEKTEAVYSALKRHAEKTQRKLRASLSEMGVPYRSFILANCVAARLTAVQINTVARLNDVRAVLPDNELKFRSPRVVYEPLRNAGPEWGLLKISADSVWALGYTGQNVIVGGGDTGYNWGHPALSRQYRGNFGDTVVHDYNWHDAIHEISPLHMDSIVKPSNNPCGLDVDEPCDDGGHGTHTMGTMVGLDSNNVVGVAPGAQWIGCRNMERGYGKPSTYIECFEWFLAPTDLDGGNPDPSRSPHVINNSWSCPEMEGCHPGNWELMRLAITNLRAAGIVVVTSAGNSGPACGSVSTPPAFFDESFSVGATNINDTIANFSARGPVVATGSGIVKPDVVAPGVGVRSSWLDSNYITSNGTSMAGPHVVGTIALMISANPNLAGQVQVIEDILRSTAVPLVTAQECNGLTGDSIPNNTYGYGRINALAAVEAAMELTAVQDIILDRQVTIYPNPASVNVKVFHQLSPGKGTVRIISADGHLVQSSSLGISPAVIDVNHVPPGVYVIQIVAGQFSAVEKLVISR